MDEPAGRATLGVAATEISLSSSATGLLCLAMASASRGSITSNTPDPPDPLTLHAPCPPPSSSTRTSHPSISRLAGGLRTRKLTACLSRPSLVALAATRSVPVVCSQRPVSAS
eukprot:381734-Hanusia_phi.AAC.1